MFNGQQINTKWLVLVAIAAFAVIAVACSTDETEPISDANNNGGVGAQPTAVADGNQGDPPPTDPGTLPYETVEVLAPIQSAKILTLESYPEQFIVEIVSGLPSGCATFVRADVTQDGTDITITVYNSVPAPDQLIACTAIYGLHDENVGLGSDFDRGTTYSVLVNDHPAETFTTGSTPLSGISSDPSPRVDDPGKGFEFAPIDSLEIIIGEDSRGQTTYSANVVWGLINGCRESVSRQVERTDESNFVIRAIVSVPERDLSCTEIYLLDSDQVLLGTLGTDLTTCATYSVIAGEKRAKFQAIAPNVRCPAPGEVPTATPVLGGGIISDGQALQLTLEAIGAEVEYGEQNKFAERFGVIPTEMLVNGQSVLVYSFAPGTSAEKASETVSANGSTIQNADGSIMSILWIAPPHFYLWGNSILLYIGDDPDMGDVLDSLAGKFAGGDYGDATSGDDD